MNLNILLVQGSYIIYLCATCIMYQTLLTFIFIFTMKECSADQIWDQDISENIQIGASTSGYDRVTLRCYPDKIKFEIKMVEDFSGVIYTRGSFYSKESICLLDAKHGKQFTMNIPFDKCKTEKEDNKYSNVVVVQYDDEFITPGDAAFALECDFSTSKDHEEITIVSGEKLKKVQRSAISLVDADPGKDKNSKYAYVESTNEEITFVPRSFHKRNDEL